MTYKPVVAGYIPPPSFGHHGKSFLDNLERFPSRHPIIKYSDHPWPGCETIPSPEIGKDHANRFAINNLAFFFGLQLLFKTNYTHVLYIESDSRVGAQYWDEIMFNEFFSSGVPALFGGSLVCYNPYNAGRRAAGHFERLVCKYNTRRNFPVAGRVPFVPSSWQSCGFGDVPKDGLELPHPHYVKAFGHKGAADATGSCVFPNGSLSIFKVGFLRDLIGKVSVVKVATESAPWDMEIGKRAWAIYGDSVYNFAAQLTSSYSSYGNVISTEAERLELLRSGRCVAVHQVKSAATI